MTTEIYNTLKKIKTKKPMFGGSCQDLTDDFQSPGEENTMVSDEEKMEKYKAEGMNKIKELIDTEINYIKDLNKINSYLDYTELSKKQSNAEVQPIPDDLSQGKDRIVFGNSRYWHFFLAFVTESNLDFSIFF